MKTSLRHILLILFIPLTIPTYLFAYDKGVHNVITEYSVETSNLNSILQGLGYKDGYKSYITGINEDNKLEKLYIFEWITKGGKLEDASLDECKPELTRAFNHFHDPTKEEWANAFFADSTTSTYTEEYHQAPKSALLWGLDYEIASQKSVQDFVENHIVGKDTIEDWSWPNARKLFYEALTSQSAVERENKFADSLRALGQVSHLIQDMSVPAHTRNDPHVFPLTTSPRPCWPSLFRDLADNLLLPVLNFPVGDHYETYTTNKQAENPENFDLLFMKQLPVYPSLDVFAPALNPDAANPLVEGSPKLAPVSGLFDRNLYTVSSPSPSLDSNTVGLAEYTNSNFFSKDTIFTYNHPAKEEISYKTTLRTARDANVDKDYEMYRTADEQQRPVATLRYWANEVSDPELQATFPKLVVTYLDDKVFESYASLLIPRAVGYSAALIDYFFRGTLEISPPTEYVYSIIDGSISPQQFTQLKAKVRNTSTVSDGSGTSIPEETGDGELIAIAKYRIMPNYAEDLSTYPSTVDELSIAMQDVPFSYSVSAPVTITNSNLLQSDVANDYLFDFSDNPIPAGVTDLYLQVIFRGTLGNEQGGAVAVGMRDLNEPQHLTFWNDTDYFLLNGVPVKADDIRNDPDVELYGYINPFVVTEKISFFRDYPVVDTSPIVEIKDLPPARYSRIIIVTDSSDTSYYFTDHFEAYWRPEVLGTEIPIINDTGIGDLPVAVHQEGSDGAWQSSPVYEVRGVVQHQRIYLINSYPSFPYIDSLPAPSENILGPFPATINELN